MTKAHRDNARGRECTLLVAPVCADIDTVVLCHAPSDDDGKAYKSNDLWAAFGCFNCHRYIDNQVGPNEHPLTPAERLAGWLRGIYRTQKIQGVYDNT